MELMCWLCQRLQLLEPCFRQREKEETMLTRRESISMFACVEEDRVRQMAFRLNRLVEPRSPHQHSWHPCLSSSSCAPATGALLNSCDTVSCRKVSLFSLVICVPSRAIVSNSFVSAALRRVNARNTARMISLNSAFSTAFTSVSWVRAAWLCDSAAVSSLQKGVTNVTFSSIS